MKPIIFSLCVLFSCCTKQVEIQDAKIAPAARIINDSALWVDCVGNSLTDGYLLDNRYVSAYPAQLDTMLRIGIDTAQNYGKNGATTENMHTNVYVHPGYRNILIAWEIGNDIYYTGRSAADAVDSFIVYCNTMRAGGWEVWAMTVPYRNNYFLYIDGLPDAVDDSTVYAQKIKSVNKLLRADFVNLIDVAKIPELTSYSSTYYYPDHCHITAAGYQLVAALARKKIAKF